MSDYVGESPYGTVCTRCGAVVALTEVHDRWHDEHDQETR